MNIVFSVEASTYEPNYEKMSILLAKSIRDTNPDANIYCGLFTNRTISDSTRKMLHKYNVTIIESIKFEVLDDSVNYFLRNYTMHYFSNILEEFLYVDIDVIVLDDLKPLYNDCIFVEEVPQHILEREEKYFELPNHRLYYNWYQMVTINNRWLYDMDYSKYKYMKDSDIEVSRRLSKMTNLIEQTKGAYYPKHSLNDSLLFHYDGMIDSGSFYKLKDYDLKKYKQYKIFIESVLQMEIDNDDQYWKSI